MDGQTVRREIAVFEDASEDASDDGSADLLLRPRGHRGNERAKGHHTIGALGTQVHAIGARSIDRQQRVQERLVDDGGSDLAALVLSQERDDGGSVQSAGSACYDGGMWTEKPRSWVLTVIFGGVALPKIWFRSIVVTLVSVIVVVIYETVPSLHVSVGAVPFSLTGFALGIFLGFRNTAAYDRFWEGRKLWGSLVNTSRTFARQVLTILDVDTAAGDAARAELAAAQRELVHLEIAYIATLRHHLRDQDPWPTLAGLLDVETIAALRSDVADNNVPLAILQRMAVRLAEARRRGWLHLLHVPMLDASLTALTDNQGACERIKNTPIPYSYTVMIHRAVAVYCGLLPFGLTESIGWATPFVVLAMSYIFFGLDAIGDEVEQPFGIDVYDLPLDSIAITIERNLRQRLGEPVPPPHEAHHHVLS